MNSDHLLLHPIGIVRSPFKTRRECPKQGREGAPEAWLEIEPAYAPGLDDVAVGEEVVVLTWLHLANRDLLKVHPRGDRSVPLKSVFAMRSPHRPNPIGIHQVRVLEVREGGRLRVHPMEVVDGTPIVDIKSVDTDAEEGGTDSTQDM